jgi:threonine synthase
MAFFECVNCSQTFETNSLDASCEVCGSAVVITGGEKSIVDREHFERLPPGVWRYGALLPRTAAQDVVSLGEGGTPLLRASRLGSDLGFGRLLIKDESRNPTGSFMDRGSTVLVSLAKERGVKTCSCVTTGNLGASLAAYCAKAGIGAEIRIRPNTDRGKLYQMIAYGARIETSSKLARKGMSDRRSISVTAGNPYILEGEKTTCFEIVQDLGWKTPDVILVPVGTGGHLSMFWRAIQQLKDSGLIDRSSCRLVGVQFSGSAPAAGGPRRAKYTNQAEESFTELEESEPILRGEAIRAMKESGGRWIETTVRETIDATGLLAGTEGIFAEPAAASVVAALQTAKSQGLIDADEAIVCVITGAGLKDTKAISRIAKATRQVVVKEDYPVARVQIGETKLQLLRSLASRPRFGYGLWKELSSRRTITTASVYQHLGELEGLALVRKSGVATARGRERVFYELTRKGSDLLKMAGRIQES